MQAREDRIVFVDYLRVVACFMVMLVHASENFYGADASGIAGNVSLLQTEANRFWVAFFDGGLGRTAVPLFIIISSFLLVPMPSGMSIQSFYKRRFLRILPPMVFFMLAYCFLPLLWGGMTLDQSLQDLRMLPFNFPSMAGHLWFMYPLISLYLFIPFISPFLERSTKKDELIFLGLFAFSTFMPWLHRFVREDLWGECFWNGFGMMWYVSGYLGYLVLAHFIRVHIRWDVKKRLIWGSVCFLLGAAFTAWSFYYKGVVGQLIETPSLEWSWEFCTPNVLLATFGIFLLFTCIQKKRTPRLVGELSRLSYGMYLMHLFFLSNLAPLLIGGDVAHPLLPVYVEIPLIALGTFLLCALATKLLSLLPWSRYMVGA